jgi:hypothetical protein
MYALIYCKFSGHTQKEYYGSRYYEMQHIKCDGKYLCDSGSQSVLPRTQRPYKSFQDNLQIPSLMANFNFTKFLTIVLCQRDKKEAPLTA